MGPKVQAATQFVRAGGEVSVITTPDLAVATLGAPEGGHDARRARNTEVGTRIVAIPTQTPETT
jgi:hypothetical protein